MSIDRELLLELEKFSFFYFKGNKSKTITEALKAFLPKYRQEREEFQKFLKSTIDGLDEVFKEEQQTIDELRKEAERQRKIEEPKPTPKRKENRTVPGAQPPQLDRNYQLWSKHYRQVRTDPDHEPQSCWICQLYPD